MAGPINASRPQQPGTNKAGDSRKRKEHPTSNTRPDNKRPKSDHRAKQRDSRTLATQASSKALKNGELDVEKFVKAREYEIRALEEGMSRSKKALSKRAFQQVPKDLRRRTASHNAKRVPKRLQSRAKKEMVEDYTPTVTARRRKPTRHMRLRLETAKKLRALGAQRKADKIKVADEKVSVKTLENTKRKAVEKSDNIKTRLPRVKKDRPANPPLPKARFRKRQKNKTWLPTHMFHAKRARMTAPKEPLWRFAIPLTPTVKSYRPTHRAANERGAIAWDMSYISTVGLEGQQRSIEGVLKALGIGSSPGENMFGAKGTKWTHGTRVWEEFAYHREVPHAPIAPVTVIWCVPPVPTKERPISEPEKRTRKIMIRIHPSAFWALWEELLRLSKVAKPQVSVEDLRFEIGSIEVTGPGAVEALQGALWPSPSTEALDRAQESIGSIWQSLKGLENQAMLPQNALLGFEIQDPRLHHPPRTIDTHTTEASQDTLLEILSIWPVDSQQPTPALFDRRSRLAAGAASSSQKAVNRRKTAAEPGQYPKPSAKDPRIPLILYSQTNSNDRQATFTLLMPWKCIQPCWYGIMYYPLSTGGQPRFGGLDEKRQLAFENGQPWFPGDFPGTAAGWQHELAERKKRGDEWKRRPKSKRVNWEVVNLGNGKKGEIGCGWACDWERLLSGQTQESKQTGSDADEQLLVSSTKDGHNALDKGTPDAPRTCPDLMHMTSSQATTALQRKSTSDPSLARSLATVRISLLVRGVPQACARIYRLPTDSAGNLRKQWLDLHPRNHAQQKGGSRNALPRLSQDAPDHIRGQRLAQSLINPPKADDDEYPACPGEEDLIGFVTTGNYNLGEGQGTGVGSILLSRVIEDGKEEPWDGRLCIVRNAGNGVGRLARWDVV